MRSRYVWQVLLAMAGFTVLAAVIAFTTGVADCSSQQAVLGAAAAPSGALPQLQQETESLERLLPRLADRGAALFLLAHHYARLGDMKKALTLLEECAALEEGFSPERTRAFAPLQNDPEFRNLIDQAQRRYPPVHRASVAFTLPDQDLFPEGLAVDSEERLFYMGSMHRKKIVKITESGEVSDFVKQGAADLMPVGGVHVDADHSVWAATDPGEKDRSELVHFDAHGKLLERYTAPGTGSRDLNDLVLRGGEIYTTDTSANLVYRFDRKSHTFATLGFSRPVFLPNGITLSGDQNLLYVADYLGVLVVDLRTNTSQDVVPDAHDTLSGIDGLYWYKGDLIGVQYGTGPFRVMRWHLAKEGRSVASSEVLERGTDLVKDPTTGAIFEGKFYFMANTGIDNLNDDKILDEQKLEPLHIAVVALEESSEQNKKKPNPHRRPAK